MSIMCLAVLYSYIYAIVVDRQIDLCSVYYWCNVHVKR